MAINEWVRKIRELLRGTVSTLVLINILLALIAFMKDVLLAVYTGTSDYADAISIAFFVPDMIGNNLLAFSIGVSCIPLFSKLYTQGIKEQFYNGIRNVTVYFMIFNGLVVLVLFILSHPLIRLLTGAATTTLYQITLPLYMILLFTLIFFPLISIGSALLQTVGRFKAAALAPLLFNIFFLGALIICLIFQIERSRGVYFIAVLIVAGVVSMFVLIGFHIMKQRQIWFHPSFKRIFKPNMQERRDLREVMAKLVPFLLILLSIQSVYFVERHLSAQEDTGSTAALNYAFRLSQFPIWIFVTAITTVVLPKISQYITLNNKTELRKILIRAVKYIIIITLPTSLFLYVLNVPIVSVLFQRGAFDAVSLKVTSGILAGYALGLVGQAISLICLRYFMAAGEMKLPLTIFISTAFLNIGLDYYLTHCFGASGLGYGAAISALINAFLIILLLKRKIIWDWSTYFNKILKILLSNLVLYTIMILTRNLNHVIFSTVSSIDYWLLIGITAISCAGVYSYCWRKFKL